SWTKKLGLPDYPAGLALASNFLASRGFLGWLELVFLIYGLFLAWQLRAVLLERAAYLPKSELGRAQLLFLSFTAGAVLISFLKVVMDLIPFFLVVEIVIIVHALACMALMLHRSREDHVRVSAAAPEVYRPGMLRTLSAGALLLLVAVFSGWMVKRALYGSQVAGSQYTDHIRFGPNNTNNIK
ncbi:MAG: hypothetical protein NTY38_28695, partial [Acidobacteria bacterium]|nr:hypothetical protein [Acidobacteriota bacterium]